MTEPNFVQLLRTKKTDYLVSEYPLAFALLSYIAMHARRYNGHPDGLFIGEALVGYTCLPGMTRQNYRTAIKRLESENLIKIVSNGRDVWTREKSTIKVTINCHLVSLCNTDVYDINSEDGNHHVNHQLTIDQPSTNHKQERTTKNNNVKEQQQTPTPLVSLPVPVVCSFSCLEGLGLLGEDVEKLMKYNTVDVERAVQVLKEQKNPVDSVMGFLLRAIQLNYQPKNNPKIALSALAESNKEKALKFASDAAEMFKARDFKLIDKIDHVLFGADKLYYELPSDEFKSEFWRLRQKYNLAPQTKPPSIAKVIEEGKIVHLQSAGSIGQGILEKLEMKT